MNYTKPNIHKINWMRTYRSIGYIHQYCTGLVTFASLARWIGKCIITSKNDGGNILSNLQSVTIMSFSRCSNWSVINTLEHNCLKKLHSSTITAQTFLCRTPRIASGRSCYMRTWQSWDFNPNIFFSFTCTHREILEA